MYATKAICTIYVLGLGSKSSLPLSRHAGTNSFAGINCQASMYAVLDRVQQASQFQAAVMMLPSCCAELHPERVPTRIQPARSRLLPVLLLDSLCPHRGRWRVRLHVRQHRWGIHPIAPRHEGTSAS